MIPESSNTIQDVIIMLGWGVKIMRMGSLFRRRLIESNISSLDEDGGPGGSWIHMGRGPGGNMGSLVWLRIVKYSHIETVQRVNTIEHMHVKQIIQVLGRCLSWIMYFILDFYSSFTIQIFFFPSKDMCILEPYVDVINLYSN